MLSNTLSSSNFLRPNNINNINSRAASSLNSNKHNNNNHTYGNSIRRSSISNSNHRHRHLCSHSKDIPPTHRISTLRCLNPRLRQEEEYQQVHLSILHSFAISTP